MGSDDTKLAHSVFATMNLATEIAWRLTDVMVAQGLITKDQARATLYALAEGIRRDAHGTTADDPTETLARTLEELADGAWPRGG